MRIFFAALLLTITPFGVGAEDAKPEPTLLDQFLDLKIARSAEISPSGSHVAYQTFENDFENDKDMSQLWVVETGGGDPVQLTHGKDSVGNYEWSADSKWIAFMRDGKLGFIRAAGGEPVMPEFKIKGAGSLTFAADGSALYFSAGPEDKKLMEAREKRYGSYNVVREDGGYRHIWRVALNADMTFDGKPEQLTKGRDYSVTGFSLSPDSKQIAFATWPSPHLADLLKGRMYVMDAAGGVPDLIDGDYGVKSTPVWHAGGGKLAYTNATGFPTLSDIVIRSSEGGDAQTIDMPTYDPNLLWFAGNDLLFGASARTGLGLFRMNTKTGKVKRLSDPDSFAFGFSMANDGKTRAFMSATGETLAEITVTKGRKTTELTALSDQIGGIAKPTKELITWKSDNGLEIEGVLTKPVGYEAGKRYPLYVRTHGGPTGTDRPLLSGSRSIYLPEVLAAEGEGALVLQTNYRGSAGYGEAFQTSNLKNLGIGPARDIIAGVKMLVDQGLVDPDKVACLGWSQGGHISAMLATYSDICTAAIMGAGISDWRTYYYNTDITQFTTEYFDATPLADDAVYAKTSPVTYIDNAKTPVLVQHGENDTRVPIANGYQFRQLLLDKGVEARMIVYSNMGHGPSTPRTRRAINEHALNWFREHLFAADKAEFVYPVAAEKDEAEKGEKSEK